VHHRLVPNSANLDDELFMAGLETHYSARDIEARILAAVRAAGLNPEQRLSPEALGALDHFHTGGLRASRELLEVVQFRAEDRVLDIGAGLAGPARLLASAFGCRVDCVEMSADYCAGAAQSGGGPGPACAGCLPRELSSRSAQSASSASISPA